MKSEISSSVFHKHAIHLFFQENKNLISIQFLRKQLFFLIIYGLLKYYKYLIKSLWLKLLIKSSKTETE